MTWGADVFQAILVAGLFIVAGCVALLMDYFKSYNDQLRERNIELATRQQERDRWFGASPEAFVEKIAALLRTTQALPAASPAVSGSPMRQRSRVPAPGTLEGEPAAADWAPEAAPAENPRHRARREAARVEGWVSKEELERLAERAARIRARYGTMTGEEAAASEAGAQKASAAGAPAESGPVQVVDQYAEATRAETDPAEPVELVSTPAPDTTAYGFEARESSAAQSLEADADREFVADIRMEEEEPVRFDARFETTAPPVDEIAARAEGSAAAMAHVEPEPTSERDWEQPGRQASAQPFHEERFEESPEPVWDLPESPAQAAVSASLAARRVVDPEVVGGFDPTDVTAEPQDPDLDALFDQTYGSPAWLGQASGTLATKVESILPTGLFEGDELSLLLAEAPPFTGIAVSIRINDFALVKAKLNSVEGVEAMTSLSNLIRSLLREDRDFAGKAEEDEYVLLFPGDVGDEGQRRLFHLSERLWDFQLRSLGGLSLMLSWGGVEVDSKTVPEAINAARDRLEESRRGRARPGSTFRSARRAS